MTPKQQDIYNYIKDAYQHPLSHHIMLAETVLKAVE